MLSSYPFYSFGQRRSLTSLPLHNPTAIFRFRNAFFSPNPLRSRAIHPAFFSTMSIPGQLTNPEQEPFTHPVSLPALSSPLVYKWLLGCSALIFGIIVVGGVTRLTESGLSITEWKPFTGTIPPLTKEDWDQEFDKYKATPEFKMSVKLLLVSSSR